MKSIIQDEKECYFCKTTYGLHDHHIFFGRNRNKSEQHGMKCWLCGLHHNLSDYSVHFNRQLDLELKKIAQRKFEENHSREEFIKEFGKSYMEE